VIHAAGFGGRPTQRPTRSALQATLAPWLSWNSPATGVRGSGSAHGPGRRPRCGWPRPACPRGG
jgi:hypothetical protein